MSRYDDKYIMQLSDRINRLELQLDGEADYGYREEIQDEIAQLITELHYLKSLSEGSYAY